MKSETHQHHDLTKPAPDWSADQCYVFAERLAILCEDGHAPTYKDYAIAHRQAANWHTPLNTTGDCKNE